MIVPEFPMGNAREPILPHLPENLESLHKEEEKIRAESLLVINADSALKEHLDMINASLDTVHAFTHGYENQTEDELTVQRLSFRPRSHVGRLLPEFSDDAARSVGNRVSG